MGIVTGNRHARKGQAVLSEHHMRDPVAPLGVELLDSESLDERPHTLHRICRRDTGCWHGMVRYYDDLIRVEDAGRCLVTAGDAEYDIKVDHEVEVRHHDIAGRDPRLSGMGG